MKFFAFAASHRKASLNQLLVNQTAGMIKTAGHEVTTEPYSALDMPLYNDEDYSNDVNTDAKNLFAERVAESDGIIVASPEYNWSYPGSLKNIIDWTSRLTPCPLAGKTVLLLSATPAPRGGINGLMHLRSPFEALSAIVFPKVFPLGTAHIALGEGEIKTPQQLELLQAITTDYLTFTQKLRS